MRPTPWLRAEPFRIQIPGTPPQKYADDFGAFVIPYEPAPDVKLRCIVSSADSNALKDYAWDHVSVSLRDRCPTWAEMTYIKDLFFAPDETVIQFHPAAADYVNLHPHVLHLWRPLLLTIPLPPKAMI